MKRALCVLMICSLFLIALPVTASATPDSSTTPPVIPSTGDIWDGTIEQPTKIVQKDGVNYYEITKCAELAFVAQTGGEWLSRNYILANNLILNSGVFEWDTNGNLKNSTLALKTWTPIGSNASYNGKFDGNGYTISGVFYSNSGINKIGLFSSVGSSGSIKNLSVVNAHLQGFEYVGGIAGLAYCDLNNCVFSGTIKGNRFIGGVTGSGSSIKDCSSYGRVYGTRSLIGGIVGSWWGSAILLEDCQNYAHVFGGTEIGGIVGEASNIVKSCINYGVVEGTGNVGGIGGAAKVDNCTNYGSVTGYNSSTGGIAGFSEQIRACVNCGTVTGESDYVGGVVARGNAANSINYGSIYGNGNNTGGIAGGWDNSNYNTVSCCSNHGTVSGNGNGVGGIIGSGFKISNCYNVSTVNGNNNVGGIVGKNENNSSLTINNCYNIGAVSVSNSTGYIGGILGSDIIFWTPDSVSITDCYYLKTPSINNNIFGCGGVTETFSEPSGFKASSDIQLKNRNSYEEWDYWNIWRINPKYNDGYPYLAFEYEDDAPPLEGITLNKTALEMSVGDTGYLLVSPIPSDAETVSLSWTSNNKSAATVNANGRVTAVGVGTATITVSGGGFSAECTVTVKERAGDEYSIGTLTIRNADGKALTAIPSGAFLVTVPITKQGTGGNCLILLAAYTAGGQYKGMMYFSAEDAPIGVTMQITLPVDNTKGEIAQIKAFPVASFSNLVPIGAASCFPAQ